MSPLKEERKPKCHPEFSSGSIVIIEFVDAEINSA